MDTRPALTLDDLIDQLTTLRSRHPELGQAKVEIPWDVGHATLGGHPAVAVVAAQAGFDWDHGRVFLSTAERVSRLNATLRRRLAIHDDLLLSLSLAVRRDGTTETTIPATIKARIERAQVQLADLKQTE